MIGENIVFKCLKFAKKFSVLNPKYRNRILKNKMIIELRNSEEYYVELANTERFKKSVIILLQYVSKACRSYLNLNLFTELGTAQPHLVE